MTNKYSHSVEDIDVSYDFVFLDRYHSSVEAVENLAEQIFDCNSLDEIYKLADSNLELWKDMRYVTSRNFRRYGNHIRYVEDKFYSAIGRIIRSSSYQNDPLLQDKLTELFGSYAVYDFFYDLKIRKSME